MAIRTKLPKYIEELARDPAIKDDPIPEPLPVTPKKRNTKIWNDPDQMKIQFQEEASKEKYRHHWVVLSNLDIMSTFCIQNHATMKEEIDPDTNRHVMTHGAQDLHGPVTIFRNEEEEIKVTLEVTGSARPIIVNEVYNSRLNGKLCITRDIAPGQVYTLTFRLYKTGKKETEEDGMTFDVSSRCSGVVLDIDPNAFKLSLDPCYQNNMRRTYHANSYR